MNRQKRHGAAVAADLGGARNARGWEESPWCLSFSEPVPYSSSEENCRYETHRGHDFAPRFIFVSCMAVPLPDKYASRYVQTRFQYRSVLRRKLKRNLAARRPSFSRDRPSRMPRPSSSCPLCLWKKGSDEGEVAREEDSPFSCPRFSDVGRDRIPPSLW